MGICEAYANLITSDMPGYILVLLDLCIIGTNTKFCIIWNEGNVEETSLSAWDVCKSRHRTETGSYRNYSFNKHVIMSKFEVAER